MRGVRVRGTRMNVVPILGMSVRLVRMPEIGVGVGVGVVRLMDLMVGRNHVDFGRGNAAAHYLAHFEAGAHIQRSGSFGEWGEGNAGVNQCAEQHVAANAGETFQISNTHRE